MNSRNGKSRRDRRLIVWAVWGLLSLNALVWGAVWHFLGSPMEVLEDRQATEELPHAGEWVVASPTPVFFPKALPWLRDRLAREDAVLARADPSEWRDLLAGSLQAEAFWQQGVLRLRESGPTRAWASPTLNERLGRLFHSPKALNRELAFSGLSLEQVQRRLREFDAQLAWLDASVATHPEYAVTEAEIARAYENHPQRWSLPPQTRARHIYRSAPEGSAPEGSAPERIEAQRAEINEIAARLAAGDGFEELAAQYSEDLATRFLGGELPLFSERHMPTDFLQAVDALEVGETSEPFQTALGWHIARVEERLPARQLTLEEARPHIRAWLQNERRSALVAQALLP
jgi:hypothetical protein